MSEKYCVELNNALSDLERQKESALKDADSKYYNRSSPMFRDNERYRWAVTTINKKIDELRKDLINSFIKS